MLVLRLLRSGVQKIRRHQYDPSAEPEYTRVLEAGENRRDFQVGDEFAASAEHQTAFRLKAIMMKTANLVGAIAADAYMLLIIMMFVARLLGWSQAGRWIGISSAVVLIPLVYLLVIGLKANRSIIYSVWLILMILFALFELIFDDILQVDLRGTSTVVIPYVMFFFAATGGMIGIATQAGKGWLITTAIIFWIMAILAFIQRGVTGL